MNTAYSVKAVAAPASNAFFAELLRATPLYHFVVGARAALKA
jgi:hypothetical protein